MRSNMPMLGMVPRKVKIVFEEGEVIELRGVQSCDFEVQTSIDEWVVTSTSVKATIISFTDKEGKCENVTKTDEQIRFLRLLTKGDRRNGKEENK